MPKNADRPDADNPEWTRKEIREARPLLDVLPGETAAVVRRRGQPRTPPPTKKLKAGHPAEKSRMKPGRSGRRKNKHS